MGAESPQVRHLIVVLGDQLDAASSALADVDPARDVVWMAEVDEESTHVSSSKQRIVVFLSAMRHFAQGLRERGLALRYTHLDDADNRGTLALELSRAITELSPARLVLTAPGDWRVLQALNLVAAQHGVPLEIRDDTHFYSTVRAFAAHAGGRKQLRLEYWYRELRRMHGILMEADGATPVGGRWNFDEDNRGSFGREAIALVERRFPDHPGRLDSFGWPVTRGDAVRALADFVEHRLPLFGRYQDAMWTGEPWLYHGHISAALNLKLLDPREVVAAAVDAWLEDRAPLPAVEGFVRQIVGWREYVRGIYWTQMPGYLERNALGASAALPSFYWTGDTEMVCLREAIGQTLEHGYAHHIQRLMVTGLYALLSGVDPRAVHAWYLSVYVDAVEWVELPNTLGMSQFADGGVMASKPYVASGKYIQRMSNYCDGCRYDPAAATGPKACPFTTLYWDFLLRHRDVLSGNMRMAMQLKNVDRLDAATQSAIAAQAERHRRATARSQG